MSPGLSTVEVRGVPHFPQNFDSDGLLFPHSLQRIWLSGAVLDIQRQKAVAEPSCRENDEHRKTEKRLFSSLGHGERFVGAVIANPGARAMTPGRWVRRGTALIGGIGALLRLARLV